MPRAMKDDWKDPYYEYDLPRKRIVINVTKSIPPHDKEVDCLDDVLSIFEKRRPKIRRIMDFGAGRLRNTHYLLRKKYTVWTVEFKEAFKTDVGREMLKKCNKFNAKARRKRFFVLRYPDEFLRFHDTVDATLLINVVNVVPEKDDRSKILREIAARLRSGGLLLWMTQHGQRSYDPGMAKRLGVTDGWAYNLHKTYQTFYRPYEIDDILAFVPRTLYRNPQKITSAKHLAYLFERV